MTGICSTNGYIFGFIHTKKIWLEKSYQYNPPNSKSQPQPVGEVQRDPMKSQRVQDVEEKISTRRRKKRNLPPKKPIKDAVDKMFF